MDSGPGLNFIIVGASVAGLSAALALKESGHNVLVLEKDSQLGGAGFEFNGCARVPPNGSKILLDWGLERETKAKCTISTGFSMYKYGAREEAKPNFLGITRWNEEWLAEARGGYMFFRHRPLLRILYDKLAPVEDVKGKRHANDLPHATVLFGAEVVEIDTEACIVKLKSGQVHTADAIIGADGARGIVRKILMLEEDVDPDEGGEPTGLAMTAAIVPKARILENGLGDVFYDGFGCTLWMGSNRAAMVTSAGEADDVMLWVYTPDPSQDGTWTEGAEIKITDVLGECDPCLRKLAELAGSATCVQLKKPYDLESWVSESGRVLALGEAAHPFPPGGLHCYSVSLEDGSFVGRIFSHTRDAERIPEFFNAFQEHRESRVTQIREMDLQYVGVFTLPDGEMQAGRDAGMRANHAAGRNALDGDMQQILDDFRVVFGYDAMDDADEWWINWGRFRDMSGSASNRTTFDFSSFSSVVNHIQEEEGNGSVEVY